MHPAGKLSYVPLTPTFPGPPPWRAWESLTALRPPAFLWREREHEAVWLGLGEAARFNSLAEAQAALRTRAADDLPLRGFCAVPFETATAPVILPELVIRWQDGRLDLAVTEAAWGLANTVRQALTNPPPLRPPLMIDGGHRVSRDAWIQAVLRARAEIRAGRLQKLVLARDSFRASLLPVPVASVLERLSATTAGCYLFAVTTGGGTFLGASPERLLRVHGNVLETESLAGTRPRGATAEADAALAAELLHSPKDAREQRIVTDFLAAALAALCDPWEIAPAPEIRKLATVQHRITVARGHLLAGITPDAVLAALHPTPAVCGAPRDPARTAIAELEGAPRGLYAGAIGTVAADTVEFAVGIRSALITSHRATVFGGAGIVEDSDPEEEWIETSWKLRPLLAALGCDRP